MYRHNNNLASSILPNISSVGFTKLRKVNTNSSAISATSTATTTISNPLTRLFTSNKSSNSILNFETSPFDENTDTRGNNITSASSNVSLSTKTSSKPLKYYSGRDKFRLPKFRGSKENGPLSANSNDTLEGSVNMTGSSSDTLTMGLDIRPELTIQTSGHLSLKIPKRILSLSLLDDSGFYGGKKGSVSSPVSTFHNLFHRSSTSAQPLNDIRIIENEEMPSTTSRIPISLSSNSSNSNVTDQVLASMYNFANPDFTLEEVDTPASSSLQELQRKLLTPTDQYILGKSKTIPSAKMSVNGLGMVPTVTTGTAISHSSSSGLLNGSPSNSMGASFAEIGLGIAKDTMPRAGEYSKRNAKFFNKLFAIIKPLCCPSQYRKQANGFLFPYLGLTVEKVTHFVKEGYVQQFSQVADIDEFHIREVTLDLTLFYSQCMTTLKIDSNTPQNFNSYSGQLSIDLLMACWTRLEFQWTTFTEKIRFYIMLIFQPLQKFLKEMSGFSIDRILFASFKDNLLTPFLVQRLSNFHNFHEDEHSLLKSNLPLVRNLINCFSMLASKTIIDDNNPLAATLLFTDTYEMLCNIDDET